RPGGLGGGAPHRGRRKGVGNRSAPHGGGSDRALAGLDVGLLGARDVADRAVGQGDLLDADRLAQRVDAAHAGHGDLVADLEVHRLEAAGHGGGPVGEHQGVDVTLGAGDDGGDLAGAGDGLELDVLLAVVLLARAAVLAPVGVAAFALAGVG